MRTKRILSIAVMAVGLSVVGPPASASLGQSPFPKTLFMDDKGRACTGLFNAGGEGAAIYQEHCTPVG
jgi:hypothetical protein